MAQWQSTGSSSQRCTGFDSQQLPAFSLSCFRLIASNLIYTSSNYNSIDYPGCRLVQTIQIFSLPPSFSSGTFSKVRAGGRPLPLHHLYMYSLTANLVSCPHPFRKNREGVWQHCHTMVCATQSVQCAPIRLQSSLRHVNRFVTDL